MCKTELSLQNVNNKTLVTNHIALFMNQHSYVPEYLIHVHNVHLQCTLIRNSTSPNSHTE